MIDFLRQRRRALLGRAIVALAAGAVLASGVPAWTEAAPAAPTLIDLKSAADLRAQFNADIGTPRLVLLLSPT